MKIYLAPVQGHTDAPWRYFHNQTYGGNNRYFTPFIRCEHGEIRAKDLQDFMRSMNAGVDTEPQVIFRNMEELEVLLEALVKAQAGAVNLNLGCPFPLHTGKGRGAGFITNISEAERLPALLAKYPDVKFSVKMRLGKEDPDEWKGIIGILNSIRLDRLYVHPRVARQQYRGELYLDRFGEILNESKNPVVFNGDIRTPDDINAVGDAFPIEGIMIARGILGRPSLAVENEEGEWPREKRIEMMMRFHNRLFRHYEENLCGEAQILSKIKPFWEYAESEIGRKAWKAIKKATNIAKYHTALDFVLA